MSRINRRDFLKMVGAGGVGAGAGFVAADISRRPREQYIPYVVTPEDYSPGIATWYNSVCGQCSAGCGISVRIREGRAKKIEGNPLHPVNQGRLCALGQSGLQALYNPDRIQQPLRRSGDTLQPISWDEALDELAGRLAQGGNTRLLSGPVRGHLGELLARFMAQIGESNGMQFDADAPAALHAANRIAFGTDITPYYDIRNADYVLSFGADFLVDWLSPVHNSLAYGHLRQGEDRARGHIVQVEPRMSLTGANADDWVPAAAGSEGVLALAIAAELLAGGAYGGPDAAEWRAALAPYTAEKVAAQADVPAERIRELATSFGASRRPLAIGGGTAAGSANGVANMLAVNALNIIAGNIGSPGGLIFNPTPALGDAPRPYRASAADVLKMLGEVRSGDVDTLIVHGANPVYHLPAAANVASALGNAGLLVSLSSFMDDTTALADLVLPLHSYLEAWSDDVPEPGVGFPVASIVQPVVAPLYDTRSAGDIVLALAARMGGTAARELAWPDMQSFLKARWQTLFEARRGGIDAADFDGFWQAVLKAGVWGEQGAAATAASVDAGAVRAGLQFTDPAAGVAVNEFPYALVPYHSATFRGGQGANLPWQQEMPDPLTSIVYRTWVELNPTTAQSMGIEDGDVVEVTSPAGTLEAPAFVFPAIRPDVIAVPLGQGHADYGRYAAGRGANALDLLDGTTDAGSGALAVDAIRVRVRKTGEVAYLPRTDGRRDTLGRQILGPEKGSGHS